MSMVYSAVYTGTVQPVYSGNLWAMKSGHYREVASLWWNGESSIGARKGGLYREVASYRVTTIDRFH